MIARASDAGVHKDHLDLGEHGVIPVPQGLADPDLIKRLEESRDLWTATEQTGTPVIQIATLAVRFAPRRTDDRDRRFRSSHKRLAQLEPRLCTFEDTCKTLEQLTGIKIDVSVSLPEDGLPIAIPKGAGFSEAAGEWRGGPELLTAIVEDIVTTTAADVGPPPNWRRDGLIMGLAGTFRRHSGKLHDQLAQRVVEAVFGTRLADYRRTRQNLFRGQRVPQSWYPDTTLLDAERADAELVKEIDLAPEEGSAPEPGEGAALNLPERK